jgi:site-specific DNA-methyltransferase (adenine-specific)
MPWPKNRPRNHDRQPRSRSPITLAPSVMTSPVHFSSKSDEWATPLELFKCISSKFGPFDLDVCASPANAKCPRFFTKAQDGLSQIWQGRCWMNPPYGSAIKSWMRKAHSEARRFQGPIVVCLVPARTDTVWWHSYAAPWQIIFLRGRVCFEGGKFTAPFPSAVVIMDNNGIPSTQYGLS